jgi:hypothetical protein
MKEEAGENLTMRWAGHVVRMGQKENGYRVLVGKSEGRRPLGRPRHRLEDNIKKKRSSRNRMWCYGLDSCGSG